MLIQPNKIIRGIILPGNSTFGKLLGTKPCERKDLECGRRPHCEGRATFESFESCGEVCEIIFRKYIHYKRTNGETLLAKHENTTQ